MQEQVDAGVEQLQGAGEGQRFAHQPAEAGAQRGVEPLDVVGGAAARGGQVLAPRNDAFVGFPQVRVASSAAVFRRQAAPEPASGAPSAAPQRVGHDLPRAPAQGQPEPYLALLTAHERAQLVQLQPVNGPRRGQRLAQGRQLAGFFLARP